MPEPGAGITATMAMRQLRKVVAGSRYQIVNYRTLGYELIVADATDAVSVRPPES
jgi:hypothetical protein